MSDELGQRDGGPPAAGAGGWPTAAALAALLWGLYLFTASQTTLFDRDEPRFARATVEAIASGDWLVPRFNGHLRADKPPLAYWLMSIPVRLFGPAEWACRFVSTLAAAACCLLTWWMGRRLFGRAAGIWAMLVVGLNPLMLVMSFLATADAIMVAFVTLGLASFVASATRGLRAVHVVVLAAGMAGAMLAKSVMGIVPLMMIVPAWLLARRHLPLRPTYLAWCGVALLAACAVFAAWLIPCDAATGGQFSRVHFGRHVLQRAAAPMEHHGGNRLLWLGVYVPVVAVAFFPWAAYLPCAISAAARLELGGRAGRAILAGATVPVFVAMSLIGTKLPHYVFPIWPGLALAVGGVLDGARRGVLGPASRRWLDRAAWLVLGAGVLGGAAALLGAYLSPAADLRLGGAVVGTLLLAGCAAAMGLQRRLGPAAAAKALVLTLLAVQVAFVLTIHRRMEAHKAVPRIARAVNAAAPAGAPVATYRFDEPSLYFYTGRRIRSFDRQRAGPRAVLNWLARARPGVLVTNDDGMDRLRRAGGEPAAAVVASQPCLNLGSARREAIFVLRRGRLAARAAATGPATGAPGGEAPGR